VSDLDVVLAAVQAGGVPRAYKPNEVPANPQMPYTIVHVTRDIPRNRDMTGSAGTWDRRATFQSFDLDADGALAFDRMAVDALDGRILAGIDGMWTVQLGSAEVRDPDKPSVIGVTSTLTCTAAP
jgi:hypothetical protein